MTEVEMKFWMDSFLVVASSPTLGYSPFYVDLRPETAAKCAGFADSAVVQLRERTKVKVEVAEHEEGGAHAGA
jgi:hypothetical protein